MNAMLALAFAAFLASASATRSPPPPTPTPPPPALAWLENVAISNLASTSEIDFLTVPPSGAGLYLMKGLQEDFWANCTQYVAVCTMPPVPIQSFTLGAGYAAIPPAPFTIKVLSKYVQVTVTKGVPVLSLASTKKPTTWTVDTYGRLCTSAQNLCLDVTSVALKTKVTVTPYNAASNTQQWVVFPSVNPDPIPTLSQPSSFYGQIMLDDPALPNMCLQSSAVFPNGTVIYNVTAAPGGGVLANGIFSASLLPGLGIRPCDASVPEQLVQTLPGIVWNNELFLGDYPTGNFALNFAATNNCLTATPDTIPNPITGLNAGRFGVVIDLKDCANLYLASAASVSYGLFAINTRGQIQAQLYIDGTLVQNDLLPLCLSYGGVNAATDKNVIDNIVFGDCSHYRYTNRWTFVPQPPPATKQPSNGLVYPAGFNFGK